MNENISATGPKTTFNEATFGSSLPSTLNVSPPLHPQKINLISTPMSRLTGDRLTTTTSNNNCHSTTNSQSNQLHSTPTQLSGILGSNSGNRLVPIQTQPQPQSSAVSSSSSENIEQQERKRIKLENDDENNEDLSALKRRILEHKYMRLRSVKDKYSEHVGELFFLQSNLSMMDYPTWRKKPQSSEFMNFVRIHRLDQSQLDDLALSSQSSSATLGTEVKIPGVGATPVAVSTRLPAAVVQLSQQGQIPGRPIGGRHGMVFGHVTPIVAPTIGNSSVPLVPGGTPIVPDIDRKSRLSLTSNGNGTPNGTDQFSVKAKQEVYVMQRITELQREGLWSEKRLPKIQEPSRPKAHWDYLLEEMVWLAADFAQERKWKKAAAKKCARMVQKYFQDKAIAAQKAEKAQEAQLKRVAAFLAKEIKIFWSNVEKLVEFKQQTRLDEKRKKALDQQLSFIVDQTERYSKQLAVGMNKPLLDTGTSKANSLQSSRISSPQRSTVSDDEFRPNECSDDDETTIAQAEAEATGYNEEIAALQKESEMDLDDFLKQLPANYLENRDKIQLSDTDGSSESDDDKDFKAEEPSEDDEDTIKEQEQAEKKVDHKKEIEELEADNDLSIEELMSKYNAGSSAPLELSDDEESTATELDSEETDDSNVTEEDEVKEADESDGEDDEKDVGLESLLNDKPEDNDELLNDAAAIAESIQPKGNTLSSTQVVTPIPFLLKHTLREYQHIGLDWLVTMHDRKLNGILADEMGLGKTIQTIALLAHLACVAGNWGPHLIIVPSSVMLNWEMEFKKWCPGFKILTYYGSQKERKMKRIGWTKVNAFHVCITSYKLVIQDHQSFRRKKWKYLILDEAQNIKNFKSQRWQLLLNFQTEQRLLLTGTPLQNNLMELWSLMHFLMPRVFQSHREFKEWFSNPMTGMIEGNSEYNESIIKRLHKVLRPFLLRRLKSEVEKQMPKKYEHVVMCRLSKRQRYLYDDFMSRAKTRETLASGNLLSVINVLMQLRKVCNHPNLFESRPTISPFRMDQIVYRAPSIVCNILDYDPFEHIDLASMNLLLIELELCITAYVAHRMRKCQTSKKLIEEIDSAPEAPPKCPTGKLRLHVRIKDNHVAEGVSKYESRVKVGTSPVMKTEGTNLVPKVIKSHSEQKLFDEPMDVPVIQSASRRKQTFQQLQPPQVTRLQQLTQPLANALVDQLKHHSYSTPILDIETSTNTQSCQTSEYYIAKIDELRKERRQHVLQMLAKINQRRCDATPIYGEDLRASLSNIDDFSMHPSTPFITASYVNCKKFINRDWSLSNTIKNVQQRAEEMNSMFENFVFFVPAVCAPTPDIHISHQKPSKVIEQNRFEKVIKHELGDKIHLLHPIVSAMSTQFPDPRLIQYDCGKLQTLDRLLRQLKSESHRVLIFTQMTRMLDVLEAFLNYHGHIYLRLDGTTRIEQRQVYMERFNNDKRIFAFILSTRSGGVGVNLTGADTVIFYDSDWNPTMDAQAQDRCHRIGQTRDVHIYRLVSEKTIEENILKKANQKRLLGDLAIEGGNFTTAYFKGSTIQDLFTVDSTEDSASARLSEVIERDKERKEQLQQNLAQTPTAEEGTKTVMNVFESALAAVEDDQDVEAAKMAKDEEAAELNEFDENIPITEESSVTTGQKDPEISKAEREIQSIINQLNPVEKYAMRFVEDTRETWTAIQLEAVEKEIEQQKREWEANRLAELQREEEERRRVEAEENNMISYSREDAKNQIWISPNTGELMPMWCPPTPPQDDNDIYVDHALGFLYEQDIISESQLPPVSIKKDYKRSRIDSSFFTDGRRVLKIRKEDQYYAPRSLFDRPPPALAKMRRELQRNRGIYRTIQLPGLKQQLPIKPLVEPEGMADWSIYEDMSILNVIQNLQGLPLNLMLISPGHTPNWDLVADIVNQSSRTYRSPKQCRWRYEAIIVPREEGKAMDSPKKQKKNKTGLKNSPLKGVRAMRTSQLYTSDNNNTFTKYSRGKFDIIKNALLKKGPQPKQVLVNPQFKNPKHAALLAEFGIASYDSPLKPQEIAAKRVERITKEKQKTAMLQNQENVVQANMQQQVQSPQQIIQVAQANPMQIQSSPQVATTNVQQTAIVVQQGTQQGAPVTTLVPSNTIQVSRAPTGVVQGGQTHGPQIVKAIVATAPGQPIMQQITLADRQQTAQQAMQNAQQNAGQMINPNSVSVVLSAPVTTVSSVQVQQPQIVSIQQPIVGVSSANIVSQAQIMQTVASQPSQVVSVAQLANIGSSSATTSVATLTTQSLRTQRIVASALQEVVLHQRSTGSQSPTVVSVSGLTPNQLSAMRLTQQVSNVAVAKSVPIGTVVTAAGKPVSSQIQFYRQPIKQQVRVMHANTGQTGGQTATVVQTPSGQTALVGPGLVTNIQGNIQVQGGTQKVAIASASGTPNVQTVATVQMAPGQPRAQFVKPVTAGKQITRQDGEMQTVMVKRPIIGQHKAQLIPQAQIFSSNVQVQQAGTSTQGQIATLVKTSGALSTTLPLSQVKSGPIKATAVNTTQVRQIQLHQPALLAQQRKGGKVTQIAQVGKTTLPTQLIVQNAKNLPGAVTVQQIQPVFRHAQPGGALTATGQIMLGKNVGRMIPVSVSSQPNARQTIQVVTGSPATGSLRAHVASGQNFQGVIQGAIKVAAANPNQAQQQAILTALQNPNQRSNASPVRLQTSGGSIVAVTVQQSSAQASGGASGTNTGSVTDITGQGSGAGAQNSQQNQTQQAQVQQGSGNVAQGQQQTK